MQRWRTLTLGLCLVLGARALLGCAHVPPEAERQVAAYGPQEPNPNWDQVTKAVWDTFRRSPHMIDRCAVKLVHGVPLNPSTDWPAYCNKFKDTSPVRARVEELRKSLTALQLSDEERSKLASGTIWIGASAEAAELSWGRPERVNRTITAGKTSEQWVYQGGSYRCSGLLSESTQPA